MSEPGSQGGISLAGLGAYALWVHSQTFVKYVQGATWPNVRSSRIFERWAEGVGLLLEERMLPYMCFAQGCQRPTRCLGASCVAYMRPRKQSPVMPPPPVGQEGLLGLWHNFLFAGARGRAVAPRAAIKRGFLWWRDGAGGDYLKADFRAALKRAHLHQFTNGLAMVVSAQSGLSQWRAQAPCELGGWAAAWFS